MQRTWTSTLSGRTSSGATPTCARPVGQILNCRDDTSFLGTRLDEALTTPSAPDAATVVRALFELCDGDVWIVSKAGPSVQRKSLAWLEHNGFYAATGLVPERVRFCLRRDEKAAHARELGLTHFIDDRVDVLGHLGGVVEHRLLFGEQSGPAPADLVPVRTWKDVAAWFGLPADVT